MKLKVLNILLILTLLNSCGNKENANIKSQSFVCTGTVLLDKNNDTCRNQSIKFTMILKDKSITVENEPCISDIEFKEFHKDKDDDMSIEFSRRFTNGITNHEILQDFVINKVSGEFGIGEQDLKVIGMNSFSVGGFCKKTNNVVD